MHSKTAQLYADVPEDAVERLLDFRRRYPYQEVTLHGRTWRYLDTVKGERALFIPAGGTTIAEVSFMSIDHLARFNLDALRRRRSGHPTRKTPGHARALPQAESITFKGGEHAIALSHEEAYFQAIDDFLAR
jgi:hypothetical protein